jgi:CubicO group peptidase (beta-lactamase class C family)
MSDVTVHGTVRAGFEPVRDAFAANFAKGLELGAAFAAYQDNELIVDLWGGYAERTCDRPWTRDTIVPVMSTTKPIAALVAARLVDQGRLDYEQPLSAVWPEFAAYGKERVTLGEALSHQAGVPGFVDPIDPQLWLDSQGIAAALAGLAPLWPPGAVSGYHPISYGVLVGEPARRADPAGRSLGRQLAEDICGPAQIDFHIGLDEVNHDRVADMRRPQAMADLGGVTPIKHAAFLARWSSPARTSPAWRRSELPAANGHGSARAVAALYGVFAHEGELFGRTLMNRDVFQAATRLRRAGHDLVLPFDLAWAAGVLRNSLGLYGPNPRSFGHSGWGGSMGLADPDRRLSAAYVMNRQSNMLMGDPRPGALIHALYDCF